MREIYGRSHSSCIFELSIEGSILKQIRENGFSCAIRHFRLEMNKLVVPPVHPLSRTISE